MNLSKVTIGGEEVGVVEGSVEFAVNPSDPSKFRRRVWNLHTVTTDVFVIDIYFDATDYLWQGW